MADEEVLGLKFAASVTGIGLVSDLSETVAGLYKAALNADVGFSKLAETTVRASNLIAGSVFFGAPLAFLGETIRVGSDLEKELTNLTVAYQGNRAAAVDSFQKVADAVDFLPVSTGEALKAFSELKLAGVDALQGFKTETIKLGNEMVNVDTTVLSLLSDIAAFRREDLGAVAFAFQRAIVGQPLLFRLRLGPQGAQIANQLVGGSKESLQALFDFIEKKGIRGLALQQSLTFSSFIVGLRDMWRKFFIEVSGLTADQGGLFRRLKDSVAGAYIALQLWFKDRERVQALAKAFVDAFDPVVGVITRLVEKGVKGLLTFFDLLGKHPWLAKAILWTAVTLGLANAFQVLLRVFDFFFGGFLSGTLGVVTTVSKMLSMFALLRAAILYMVPTLDILTIAISGIRFAVTSLGFAWTQLLAIVGSGRVLSTLISFVSSLSAPSSFIAGLIEGGGEFLLVFGRMIVGIGAAIGLFIAFAAVVRGFVRTIRFDAIWEGFVEGFRDAQELLKPFAEAFNTVKEAIDGVFMRLNAAVDSTFAFFGVSQNAFNMWRDIGYMVGFVAGIVATVLFGAFKLVLGIVQTIARFVGMIITGLQFIGGMVGITVPSLGAPGEMFNTTPVAGGGRPGPSLTPAPNARGQVSITVGEMPINVQVPAGTTTEQAKSVMEQIQKQQVGMFSGLAEEYAF